MSGTVMVPRTVPSFSGAVVCVTLQEVSFADAPATVLAQARIEGVSHDAGSNTVIPFTLDAGDWAIVPSNDYAVHARVNVAAGAAPHAGDLFSDRRHAVLTRGHGNRVDIRVAPSQIGDTE